MGSSFAYSSEGDISRSGQEGDDHNGDDGDDGGGHDADKLVIMMGVDRGQCPCLMIMAIDTEDANGVQGANSHGDADSMRMPAPHDGPSQVRIDRPETYRRRRRRSVPMLVTNEFEQC